MLDTLIPTQRNMTVMRVRHVIKWADRSLNIRTARLRRLIALTRARSKIISRAITANARTRQKAGTPSRTACSHRMMCRDLPANACSVFFGTKTWPGIDHRLSPLHIEMSADFAATTSRKTTAMSTRDSRSKTSSYDMRQCAYFIGLAIQLCMIIA